MKKIISFVREQWLRIIATIALIALCMHWGCFGGLGIVPGGIAVLLWTS